MVAVGDDADAAEAQEDEFLCPPCDEEEVFPLRRPRIPTMPSESEVEDHRKTHLPYRSWCEPCVMGRGLGEQRGAHRGREHLIPRIGIDYWFITSKGIMKRDELQYSKDSIGEKKLLDDRKKGIIMMCVVIRCYETRCVFGHVVPCKGSDEDKYVVDLICSDLAWLGHTRVLLKTDNERALLSLVAKALMAIRVQVTMDTVSTEQSPEGDSQGNGGTEVGVRALRGQFRTLKICLERRIGQSIPVQHPLTAWLIEHVSLLLNATHKGEDGLTGWARARGRDFGLNVYGICERVLWKQPPKGPQHDVHGNMGPRMLPGIFIGYHRDSNMYRVIDEEGNVMKTRALQSRPMSERWDAEAVKAITCTPWSLRPRPGVVRVEMGPPVEQHEPAAPAAPALPRRFKITMKILRDYGFTENCEQCTHVRAFNEAKPGLGHGESCRKRIMEAMAASAPGAERLREYEGRVDRAIAHRMAHDLADTGTSPAPEDGVVGSTGASSSGTLRDEHGMAIDVPGVTGSDPPGGVRDLPRGPHPQDAGVPKQISPRSVPSRAADDPMGDEEMMLMNLEHDPECLAMVHELGCGERAYMRDRKRGVKHLVSEIYSPPRVTKVLSSMPGHLLTPGFALDLTCTDSLDGRPWDFDDPKKRTRARELLRAQKPLFLIGSPMCRAWSTWQHLNALRRDPDVIERELIRARVHLRFVLELYQEQIDGGRFFLHEHPRAAASWQESEVVEMLKNPEVSLVTADQCMHGAEVTYGYLKGQPVRKRTGFMSNAPALLARLKVQCNGREGRCERSKGGTHVIASGRVARDSERYSKQLCRAILRGMTDEVRTRGIARSGEVGLHAVTDDAEVDKQLHGPEQGYSGRFRDDMTHQVLRDDLVHEARQKELQYFTSKGVWLKRPKGEAKRRTGKGPISVRWVDVNKGDDLCPRYRSRLVARQLKAHDKTGSSYFAPTPPLEALRTILSFATSKIGDWVPCYEPKSKRRMQIAFVDISRAYFNARVEPNSETYVQLPEEDPDNVSCCAKLLRHMYGTRAAADGWQEECSSFLVQTMGFCQGLSSPCVFRHPSKQLVVSVHGDDFTIAGACEDLDWFEAVIQEHYECTVQPRIGPGPEDASEGLVLNRVVRWTAEGVEYEADPRQAEKLIAECGLTGSNTVATPGQRLAFAELEKDLPLEKKLHTAFRGAAARSNYLAADRVDVQFAAKEICRWMSSPTEQSWAAMKRLCRYLVGLPRMVCTFNFQEAKGIEVYTDTDWAGCPRTRKSTSGGLVMLGRHLIKSWSSTQASISLSSGEAELNGVVRGAGIGLGYQSLVKDLGQHVPVRVWTDSSAAIGICSRQGLGKLRHLDIHTLWVQQAIRAQKIVLCKVDGETNPADLLTKHSLTRERLIELTKSLECRFRGGRASLAPKVRAMPSTRMTMADASNLSVDTLEEETYALHYVYKPNEEGMLEVKDMKAVRVKGELVLPHTHFEPEEVARRCPPLQVPDAVDADDPLDHEDDALLQAGKRIIDELMADTARQGRRRRLQPG